MCCISRKHFHFLKNLLILYEKFKFDRSNSNACKPIEQRKVKENVIIGDTSSDSDNDGKVDQTVVGRRPPKSEQKSATEDQDIESEIEESDESR